MAQSKKISGEKYCNDVKRKGELPVLFTINGFTKDPNEEFFFIECESCKTKIAMPPEEAYDGQCLQVIRKVYPNLEKCGSCQAPHKIIVVDQFKP